VLRLLDESDCGVTRQEAVKILCDGADVTEAKSQKVQRALLSLFERGFIRRRGRRYYAIELEELEQAYGLTDDLDPDEAYGDADLYA
jgi:hypothetical protein